MKYFIVLLLFSFNLWADNKCEQVRQDLLVLENNLLNGKMPLCTSEGAPPEPYCCNPEKEYSCKTRQELEVEYNAAIGDLIIAEGLLALGMSIESNHNALVNMPSSRLTEITNYTDELDRSVQTADLLFDAIADRDGDQRSIWAEFDEQRRQSNQPEVTRANVSTFVANHCSRPENEESAFCQRINSVSRAENADADLYGHWMETLTGLLVADDNSSPSDSERERVDRFRTYQEKLSIQLGGNQMSPQDYLNSETYADIQTLKNKINQYKAKRNEEEHKEEAAQIASEILQISNDLDRISMNFADTSTASATVGRFISTNFDSVMAQMNMPDLLLTDPVTQNFKKTHEMFEKDYQRFNQNISKKVEEALYQQRSRDTGSGQTIGQICNGNFNIDCLRRVCGTSNCQQSSLRDLNLTEFLNEANELQKQKDIKERLALAKGCLESENYETTEQKRSCLNQIAGDLANVSQSELDALRANVQNLDYLISRQNNVHPFKNLNLEKAMAVHLLKSESCNTDATDLLTVRRNYCQEQSRQSDISFGSNRNINSEYLNLSVQGEAIVINMNHNDIRGAMQGGEVRITDEERNQLKEDCGKEDSTVSVSICRYYRDQAAHAERVRVARERESAAQERRNIRIQRYQDEQESLAGAFFTGAGQELLMWSPMLIGAVAERQVVKDEMRYYQQSIVSYDNWYMENLPVWQSYYDNLGNGSVTNWGYDFATPTNMNTAITFQAANTSSNFSNNSGMQFSYTPLPTSIDTTIRTPAATGGSDSFGFSF